MIARPKAGQQQGYWLAEGYVHGRLVLAEGTTRAEATKQWATAACRRLRAMRPFRMQGLLP